MSPRLGTRGSSLAVDLISLIEEDVLEVNIVFESIVAVIASVAVVAATKQELRIHMLLGTSSLSAKLYQLETLLLIPL